jgi:hypothetical protein
MAKDAQKATGKTTSEKGTSGPEEVRRLHPGQRCGTGCFPQQKGGKR